MPLHSQDEVHKLSLADPEFFWQHQAEHITWHKQPSSALSKNKKVLQNGVSHDHWEWFPGGEISTCYNCVDRHVVSGNGDSTAVIWDSPVTKSKRTFTYKQLLSEVEVFAGVLRDEGVRKGDVVLMYMPMIPAALIAILAVSRLGAIHAVVFGGFAANSLAQRIESSRPLIVLTASCGIDGTKPPIDYKPLVTEAIKISPFKPEKIIVWERDQLLWDPIDKEAGQLNWQELTKDARSRGVKADCVPINSNDGIYIIYTSGTTDLPKGVLREAGGHAVGLHLSMRYVFGIRGPGDVMFCASDLGWVVGHSYILYAPLLVGATTILFEGKPVGTPNAGTFFRIVEEHNVKTLFTAPTALRTIRRDDPENRHLKEIGQRGGLKSLQALFLAGERSEPSLITMYQKLLNNYGSERAKVIDNWWSTESGSPISGIALVPDEGDVCAAMRSAKPLCIKPGSAGKAMPGFDVHVVDDEGFDVVNGKMGNIVLAMPLAPTAFRTLWQEDERFYKSYLKQFNGKWFSTGDSGIIDPDGYIHVMSRSDDIINVAAHRLSTGAIEQAISTHSNVAECCVVGIPDALKGHLPFAFVTPSTPEQPSVFPSDQLYGEVQRLVRSQIGPIASLGGMIQGKGMIPKTRSGKTLRRVLRELLENAVNGDWGKEPQVPATVEDIAVVHAAQRKLEEYFKTKAGNLQARAKL